MARSLDRDLMWPHCCARDTRQTSKLPQHIERLLMILAQLHALDIARYIGGATDSPCDHTRRCVDSIPPPQR